MDPVSYLLIRTPQPRMGGGEAVPPPGSISGRRIAFSLFGILLGIVASFYVTGLSSRPPSPAGGQPAPREEPSSAESFSPGKQTQEPRVISDWSWRRFRTVGVLALVICCLTYQGLYFSLRLYQNEPAGIILFISFQYGFFWQSAVNAARLVL